MVNRRFWLLVVLAVLVFSVAEVKPRWPISARVLDNRDLAFLPHVGSTPYLAMNVRFAPVDEFKSQVESQLNIALKSRGEAHVTVITPPEFQKVLRHHLTIGEINRIALELDIQAADLELVCLGRGEKLEPRQLLSTYFLVVKSQKLLEIREKILEQYVAKGGQAEDFDPEAYHPHVTLGFSKRDLHSSDGVTKNADSCIADLKIVE
ncbi:MAG: hypothetical protein H6624_06080 [Bdellovibrionaceae bacterium]|nr:hypothetical protein [Bdellovibrionales bacterium]MCB9083891.1 hypothetical protein [Pseudobdellovibrionaceae bacterium]